LTDGTGAPSLASGGHWMGMFEYTADMRDLALDGRHWRAQFGLRRPLDGHV